jgi:hypothetical protein
MCDRLPRWRIASASRHVPDRVQDGVYRHHPASSIL